MPIQPHSRHTVADLLDFLKDQLGTIHAHNFRHDWAVVVEESGDLPRAAVTSIRLDYKSGQLVLEVD